MTITESTSTPAAEVAARVSPADALTVTTGADYWTTAAVSSAGLRSIRMADGPHGLRVQDDENPDHLGLGRSMPATCFPPAVTLASSWDPALVEQVGAALAREARAAGVDVVLGPGMNIKRSPLCGRNFEYYSEDPFLTARMAGAMVTGIQSRGIGACVKHFAVNNQETDRLRISARVDDRTVRETYLRAFQHVVRDANPWAIMAAYNRVNGVFASENPWLLTTVLRDEWGYDGVVVSDWGAVHDPVAAVNAGLDLRMPGRPEDDRIRDAHAQGLVDEGALRRSVDNIARLAERTASDEDGAFDPAAHAALVRRAANESAVLLTNTDAALPLQVAAGTRIAVIGELARTPRYQGAGSSAVNATAVTTALDALTTRVEAAGGTVAFRPGYSLDAEQHDQLITDAVAAAETCDVVILCLGLPGQYEAEGRDRTTIELPTNQLDLVEAISGKAPRTVVALSNGSAVTTATWKHSVDAIVEFWLTGQTHGHTVADVLLGDVNPSGKLAETVPVRLEDSAVSLNFPGEHGEVNYGEGIFVGYRDSATRNIEVDYAFGHGLSYTTFEYTDLQVTSADASHPLQVEFSITNTGAVAGAEVAQVYVTQHEATLRVPTIELAGWAKTSLQPGETKRIRIAVSRDQLEHWNPSAGTWTFDGGHVTVHVGSSSLDFRQQADIHLPVEQILVPVTTESTFLEWLEHPEAGAALQSLLDDRGGLKGRMGDLYSDETGRDTVYSMPMVNLMEFPGVPLTPNDLAAILAAK